MNFLFGGNISECRVSIYRLKLVGEKVAHEEIFLEHTFAYRPRQIGLKNRDVACHLSHHVAFDYRMVKNSNHLHFSIANCSS